MSERDAFGREKGEDSLAAMGWSSSVTPNTPTPVPAEPATPAPAPTPVQAARPASRPSMTAGEPLASPSSSSSGQPAWTPGPPASYVRRRRARGIVVPLFIVGVVAIGIGGVTTVFEAGNDALDSISRSIDDATLNGGSTSKRPSSGTSLVRPAALRAALAKLPAGKIELLTVAPDRISANVIVKGKMHAVQVTAGGEINDVPTPATGTGNAVKVNSVAPSRIARTAAKRAGRRVGSVSYLVLIHILGKDEWQLFFDDGLHFSASANGKKVRRVG